MKVLLICDDYWHPGKTAVEGIEPLKQNGFEFDIIFNANDFTADMLKNYPVVIMCKSDEISQSDKQPWKTEEIQKA
ncbi:MAG: ThuA domain-containing protein, partial [Treponema sp.]|nr:ThuA domain-containing protein [Treponema sp.]